jgi:hypothetical protein
MEPFEDDKLVAALESLRPGPRPAFTAELDERAAAGFPRRGSSRLSALADRLRAIQPRRALIPAGATALAAVAAVTVVVAIGEEGVAPPSAVRLDSSPPSAAHLDSAPPAKPSGGGASTQYSTAVPSASGSSGASEAAAAGPASSSGRASSGPYAAQAPRRDIERSAELVLGTDPTEVRKAASEVFQTVHTYRGIVLDSSIRDGADGEAGARFELLIPSAKLSDALADLSGIAEVRSRHEATADITAPTVRTGERLRDSQAKVESLLTQLSAADTEAERTAAEAQLRGERRHAASLRSQLSSLERRANLSRVSLRIETGATASSDDGAAGWSIGDALDDAGHILAIAAGVTIVGLAIVGPIALFALLAWLANRTRIRRARQRALA